MPEPTTATSAQSTALDIDRDFAAVASQLAGTGREAAPAPRAEGQTEGARGDQEEGPEEAVEPHRRGVGRAQDVGGGEFERRADRDGGRGLTDQGAGS